MTVTIGVDSYGDEDGLLDYATNRGITISGDKTQLLILAMDWLEIQQYLGVKYEEYQQLEFPRTHYIYGDIVGDVPNDVVTAQYVGALLIDSGEDLNPVVERATKVEKVDVLSITYMDNSNETNSYPQLYSLLANYLSNSGMEFQVSR